MSEDLRFPIGDFDPDFELSLDSRNSFFQTIGELPAKISDAVADLNDEQLDTVYRTDGWTIRQVVHHVADSHLNSYCRFKLALTEEYPTIWGYYEDRWALLPDYKLPIESSLKIIEGVHTRWTAMLRAMREDNFARKLDHPESGEWTLDKMLGLYSWHSKHHTAHITNLRERKGW